MIYQVKKLVKYGQKRKTTLLLSYKAKIAGHGRGKYEEKSVFIPVCTSVPMSRKLDTF